MLAQQHRIGHSVRGHIFGHICRRIDGDADNFEAIFRIFGAQALQQRYFAAARVAPGRPEIHHKQLAAVLGQAMGPAVQAR